MKKIILLLSLLAFTASMIVALDINDPNDRLYDDLEFWQERGYYRHLPPVQPYPAQLLIELLDKVVEQGTRDDVEKAEEYLAEIQQPFHMEATVEGSSSINNSGIGVTNLGAYAELRGQFGDLDWLTAWGEVGGFAVINYENPDYFTYNANYPYSGAPTLDMKPDAGGIGNIDFMESLSSSMTIGTSNLYFTGGMTRASYGPFYDDGIVLSNNANHQGHFELTWRGDEFSFSSILLTLVGTDNLGQGSYNNKYLVMHSYNWAPLDWLDIGFVETVVYGERFDPLYILPFTELFYSQGYAGFDDNALMGITARILLPEAIEIAGAIYVDDVGFNDLIKFNFDTKLKLAWEAGVSWSPGEKWLHKVSFDYTAVMPYMYTHKPKDDTSPMTGVMNPDNYTQAGRSLGVSLSPNSDRFQLNAEFRPWKYLDIGFHTSLRRHGNASIVNGVNVVDPTQDNLDGSHDNDDLLPGDGSIYDAGVDDSQQYVFQDSNNFLNQDVIEYIFQIGLDLSTKVILGKKDQMSLEGSIGYTFERIWNSGRNSTYGTSPEEGADEVNNYLSIFVGFNF